MLDQDPNLPTALLDFPGHEGQDGPRQRWRFERPVRWLVAHDPSQVAGLLDAAHEHARQGQWCVGWVAYEAAPGLDAHLPVKALPPGQPYAVWAVFDEAQPWLGDDIVPARTEWSAGPWQADLDDDPAQRRVEQIHELIRAGEVYQVNLTTQLHAPYQGEPASLWPYFMALRRSQPQGYGLMLDARAACRAPGAVLSVSPELFFDWDGQTLTTRPMKGTAARGLDAASDAAAADHLRTSVKERAENLMIVDLLRNDLSRVAEVGSVKVPSLFDVQALPTVWQMTSTVTARSKAGVKLSDVFTALFPCGSVTGAPKRQAMHHIARLERTARRVYCGAVGLMAPGGRVTFNVPIRTVCVHTPPPPAPWSAHCGIGSGVTLDATPAGEVAEWKAKQAFLTRADSPFHLLESLRIDQGRIDRLEAHIQRLAGSARHFGWAWNDALASRVRQALVDLCQAHPAGVHRVRLLLSVDGEVDAQASPLSGPGSVTKNSPAPDDQATLTVQLADRAMPPADDFIRHKTTRRAIYAAFKPPEGVFDTLLFNQAGELTEFTIGNVALKLDGQWYTPPLSVGLLPGVMRTSLLAEGLLTERTLTTLDLERAQGLALLNSVRGWLPVSLTRATAHD
ncbi:MAG TPA: chorismate-binding protein [Aquabacterium sp.]|uniref:chorismate-binding protein n=1 Tax=Aquabacterium sp. TaxID=1872578 RepID=UPI002E381EA9|nr:chorismate-binding protein [Aquabacterium sp.]HEX5355034.1 chorismate-binding protein [Aquabacterium sp.]